MIARQLRRTASIVAPASRLRLAAVAVEASARELTAAVSRHRRYLTSASQRKLFATAAPCAAYCTRAVLLIGANIR
jgi:hypothetical protein